MRYLQAHHWPGNVRELLAALESARIQSGGRRIEAQHLPIEVRGPSARENGAHERYRQSGAPEHERAAITRALTEAGGPAAPRPSGSG